MFKGTILFIHGFTSSSQQNWFPYISKKLDEVGISYRIPDLPGGTYPHLNNWLEKMQEVITHVEGPLILVGHSLGTRAILEYLDKYKAEVEKVFLIAAFANKLENAQRHDDGRSYADFFEHKVDASEIKKHVQDFIVVHSLEDSSIEFDQAKEISDDLNARLIEVKGRDHISESEHGEFIFQILKEELKF